MRSIAIRPSSGLLLATLTLVASACGDGTSCPTGQLDCYGVCADPRSNVYHCGACGKACGAYETCTAGQCSSCPQGSLLCPGTDDALACTPVTEDPHNCGGCGLACRAPEGGGTTSCKAGVCVPACPAPSQLCSAAVAGDELTLACVDTASNATHCGACGHGCGAHQLCQESACIDCPVGQLRCPGGEGAEACTPVLYDAQNCGACGRTCPAGKACQNGVCAGPGLSTCPAARPDLPPLLVDLDNDPGNCGACGAACLATEVCREAACRPCPVAACANRCVDTGRDDLNCGGCFRACLSGTACVEGVCAEPVKIVLLAPLDRGHAPTTPYLARVRVESALPIKRVVLESPVLPAPPDGGLPAAEMALASPANLPPTEWTYPMPARDVPAVELTVRAYDIAYVEGAADAEAHRATLTAVLPTRVPPSTPPSLAAFGPEGALAANSWIAINAPPVRFEATELGPTATSVTLVDLSGMAFATAPVEGGKAVFLIEPGDLPVDNGVTRVRACVWDDAGQSSPAACSAPSLDFSVGRVPSHSDGARALSTAQPDGTAATHWFVGAPSATGFEGRPESPILSVPAHAVLPALPTTSALPGRYLSDSLQRADTTRALLAIRGDATAVDRLECVPGASSCTPTARAPFLTAGAHRVVRLLMVTPTTVLASTSIGELVVAHPTAASEPPGEFAQPGTSPCYGPTLESYATAGGGVVFWCRDTPAYTPGTTRYWLALAAPRAGVVVLQTPFVGLPRSLLAAPTGELLWSYSDETSTYYASGTDFDGQAAVSPAAPPVKVGGVPSSLLLRRGTVLFLAPDPQTYKSTFFLLDLVPTPTIHSPTPPSATVGEVGNPVRSRLGASLLSVSDDLLKMIYLTTDPDGARTLWLVDLDTGAAQPLLRSRDLAVNPAWGGFLPHFVSAPSALPTAVSGTPAPGTLAAVPVVVYGEYVTPGGPNPGAVGIRLYAARYDRSPGPAQVVQLDRPAFFPINLPSAPITTTATGTAVLFYEYREGAAGDLYAFPLGGAGPSATARLVLEHSAGYALREDVGRLLVAHRSGLLFAGDLHPGSDPGAGLRPVLEATPRADFATAQGLPFGFTHDGAHVWSLIGARSAWGSGGRLVGEVEVADLATGRRANFGTVAIADPPAVGAQSSPCFLRSGAVAVGLSPLAPYSGLVELFASTGTARAAFGLDAYLSTPLGCRVSGDETEALITDIDSGLLASVAASATSVVGERLLTGSSLRTSSPWTRSPFAPPTAPEYEVRCGTRPAGLTGIEFKTWGGADGAAGRRVPLTYGQCPSIAGLTRTETDQLLFGLLTEPNAFAPFVAPLGGRPPPAQPLP